MKESVEKYALAMWCLEETSFQTAFQALEAFEVFHTLYICGVKDSDAGLQDLSFSEKERLLRRAHLELAVNVVNGNGEGVWEE